MGQQTSSLPLLTAECSWIYPGASLRDISLYLSAGAMGRRAALRISNVLRFLDVLNGEDFIVAENAPLGDVYLLDDDRHALVADGGDVALYDRVEGLERWRVELSFNGSKRKPTPPIVVPLPGQLAIRVARDQQRALLYGYATADMHNPEPNDCRRVFELDLTDGRILWSSVLPQVKPSQLCFEYTDNDEFVEGTCQGFFELGYYTKKRLRFAARTGDNCHPRNASEHAAQGAALWSVQLPQFNRSGSNVIATEHFTGRTVEVPPSPFGSIAVCATEGKAAYWKKDGLGLIDLPTAKTIAMFDVPEVPITMDFSRDGTTLLVLSAKCELLRFSL